MMVEVLLGFISITLLVSTSVSAVRYGITKYRRNRSTR